MRVESNEASYPNTPYLGDPIGRRRCAPPDTIRRVCVPQPVVKATSDVMGRIGREQRECYVWWGGWFSSNGLAQVATAYFPTVQTAFGRVAFGTEDFYRLHEQLRRRDQVLIAELHTHPPGAGGQNEVDAAHAAAPYPGFITVVVPDFAHPHFHDLRDCYVYEYIAANKWNQLSPDEIQAKFVIEETFVTVSDE